MHDKNNFDFNDNDGWERYSKLVLTKLNEMSCDIKELQKATYKTVTEVETLKTKAAFLGALFGTGFSILITAIFQTFANWTKP